MEKMDKSEKLPRGLEGLRKLADDMYEESSLWEYLTFDVERDWGVDAGNEGSLRDTLSRLADEIESERPAPEVLDADGVPIHKGELLSHNRPDSWERLEKDAREFARDNQLPHDVDQMERDALDLIRRAKALAGVER